MGLGFAAADMGADQSMIMEQRISENETLLFFNRDEHRLFGVLHEPLRETRGHGIILCHAFAEEKLWAHRAYVSFARLLASHGFTVLRFDFFGQGDSDGEFEDSTVDSRRKDTHAAIGFLRGCADRPDRVSLMGLRFGASVAALVANERSDVDRLILWEPIVDGEKYLMELLRVNLTTQLAVWREVRDDRATLIRSLERGETVNVDGYLISPALHEQMRKTQLLSGNQRFPRPCLIVSINRKAGQRHPPAAERLAARYPGASLRTTVEQRFWQETAAFCPRADRAARLSLDWLLESA